MSIPDFTTLVAVDKKHADELQVTWAGWERNRPELMTRPLLFVCDAQAGGPEWWRDRLSFVRHKLKRFCLWEPKELYGQCATQREIMLTSLVYAPASVIETPWYLKLDTDTHADSPGDWIKPEWFIDQPEFVSHPWRYTKPAEFITRLDEWAANVPQLSQYPPPVQVTSAPDRKQGHKRIISFVFFGQTSFARLAGDLLGMPKEYCLPVPSQDTFVWYIAARMGLSWRSVNMKACGWSHHKVRIGER